MDCGKVGFPPIPSKGCFCLVCPKPLEPFSFPSLVHLIPAPLLPSKICLGAAVWWLSWEEGHIRSTGHGRGGRNRSF